MAVGLEPPKDLSPVSGIKIGVGSAGIKKLGRRDLVLFELHPSASVAGVFTQNAFCAAPVQICRAHPADAIQYLLINTGNANAATGDLGIQAAQECCQAVASAAGVNINQVWPFSTGVIGEHLPVEKISAAIPQLLKDCHENHWIAAAEGIMTTDTVSKGCSRVLHWRGHQVTITGISKGAGMIKPNMATMLAFIATDANIKQPTLQAMLERVVERSFNRITIDSDTSTNDACVLMASAQSSAPEVSSKDAEWYQAFELALLEVAQILAQAIIRDGEGATKFVTVQVNQGSNAAECLKVAYAIAESPLVKTALFASDPNWGRLAMAIGKAGIHDLDVSNVVVYLDQVCLMSKGARDSNYKEELGAAVMAQDEITIRVDLNRGNVSETLWTTDFSYDYVKINAEYRT